MVDDKDVTKTVVVLLDWQTVEQLAPVFSIRVSLLFRGDVSHSDCCQAIFNYTREEKMNDCKARILNKLKNQADTQNLEDLFLWRLLFSFC